MTDSLHCVLALDNLTFLINHYFFILFFSIIFHFERVNKLKYQISINKALTSVIIDFSFFISSL